MAHRKHKKQREEPHCTVEELTAIITFQTGGCFLTPTDDLNEVWPALYVGDESSAKNTYQLKRLGVTHVVNTALGKTAYHVNTNHVYYRKAGIAWKGIEATDIMNFKIDRYFDETTQFIKEALHSGGKVLVHCRQGLSRSATIALAYLMVTHHLTAQEAVRAVREKREINPNPGFLQQLCDLNETLWKKKHFDENVDVESLSRPSEVDIPSEEPQ